MILVFVISTVCAIYSIAAIKCGETEIYSIDLAEPEWFTDFGISFNACNSNYMLKHRIACAILPVLTIAALFFTGKVSRITIAIILICAILYNCFNSEPIDATYSNSKKYPYWVFCKLKKEAEANCIKSDKYDIMYNACKAYSAMCHRVHVAQILSFICPLLAAIEIGLI